MEEVGIKALNIIVENLQKWIDMAPAYVQDLLIRYTNYKKFWLTCWIVTEIIVFILSCILIRFWLKKDDSFAVSFWGMFAIGCIVCLFMSIYFLVKIHYVPDLYLIDDFIWCQSCK